MAALAAALTVAAPAAKARACGYEDVIIPALALGLLAPSEVGTAMPVGDASAARFVLGWSWQIPVAARHRIVPSVDLLPSSDGASWRGRIGYRYARRNAFAGAGIGVDASGANLSPEIGVKFAHDTPRDDDDVDVSLHLLARAEMAPASGHLRGATILLGWNFF